MLPTDPQDPKDKAGDSADTCAQAFKQLQTPTPSFPMVCPREKEERMYLLDCSCSPYCSSKFTHGEFTPSHFQVVLPGHLGIFCESQIPRPVAGCLQVLVEARGSG